jgi:hypothetical protein
METSNLFTPYDEAMQTRELQMLKTILPYLEEKQKNQIGILIQYMQFRQWNRLIHNSSSALGACEIPAGNERRSAMLGALREYCTPKEKETIDTILNLFCILENYEAFLS